MFFLIINVIFFVFYFPSVVLGEESAEWKELNLQESKVLEIMENIRRDNLTPEDLFRHLQEGEELDPEDVDFLRSWRDVQTELFQQVDKYTRGQFEYFLQMAQRKMVVLHSQFLKATTSMVSSNAIERDGITKLKNDWRQLLDLYAIINANWDDFEHPPSNKLVKNIDEYFKLARILTKKLRNFLNFPSTPSADSILNCEMNSIQAQFPVLLKNLNLLFNLFLRRGSTTRSTPLADELWEINRQIGEKMGLEVEIVGRAKFHKFVDEHHGEDEINYLMPAHRVFPFDIFVMAHAMPQGSIAFTKGYSYLPKWIAKMIEKSNDFVITETPDLREQFERKVGVVHPKVVLYTPEGAVSRWNENKKVTEKTPNLLWHNMKKLGYKINIIPMTMEISPTFLTRSGTIENKKLVGRIGPILDNEKVNLLIKAKEGLDVEDDKKGEEFLTLYLRSVFQFHTANHSQLSNEELRRRIDEQIGI